MAITDLLTPVTSSATARPITDTLAAPGYTHGASSATLAAGTNWADGVVYFSIYTTTTIGSTTVKDPTTQTDWKATKSGTALTNMILTGGSATKDYTTGAIVELTPTSRWAYDQYQWATAHGNLDGTLKASAIQSALGLGSASLNGWNPLGYTFNSVTALGNRSYSCVVSGQDVTSTLSAGMRIRTTRTVAAPTQSTSLNGTTQYWSKTSPAGMTFTDGFTVIGWVKLTAYQLSIIAARDSATPDGWAFYFNASGQLIIGGQRAADDYGTSYQSAALNKWVHVAATYNSATTTVTMYFDGASVPVAYTNNANTGIVQGTGPLQIGKNSGANFFKGSIAQVAIFSTVLSAATIQSYYSQGLAGTETSLISAYSFNGNANDLNTTNANNLTANGSAVATNADSPFGGQAGGTISSTLDYGIVQSATFSTNTTVVVQVPEGCTIPTSGGVSAVSYATVKAPYGMPVQTGKWRVESILKALATASSAGGYQPATGYALTVPIGEWMVGDKSTVYLAHSTSEAADVTATLSTNTSTETDPRFTTEHGVHNVFEHHTPRYTRESVSNAAVTTYTFLLSPVQGTVSSMAVKGNSAQSVIFAENAYL